MKFIKNSIDSENLQDSISHADLEKQMANCDIESKLLNGHHSKEGNPLKKINMEEVVEIPKLSNGVHEKSPTKCNGKVNGFYEEEEEDFQLVLEDSSEEGGSPTKKIYDDAISAPRIVQEIEDLLGINANSVGLEEELNNLESIEDNLDNDDDVEDPINIPQEIQEVFEENEGDKELKESGEEATEGTEKLDISLNKNSEITECDTSSNMNLVFDEVEIGSEVTDLQNAKESDTKIIDNSNEVECTVESTTETSEIKQVDQCETEIVEKHQKRSEKEIDDREKVDSSLPQPSVTKEDTSEELPLTQNSGLSEDSEEWMVVDAVEASDEEKLSEQQISDVSLNSTKNESLVEVTINKNDELRNSHLESSSEKQEEDMIEQKSQPENITTALSLPCEGEGVRKRSASENNEEIEVKKPKLEEEQSNLVESTSPILKRPLSETEENESKRTKLDDTTTQECIFVNNKNCLDQLNESQTMDGGKTKDKSSAEKSDEDSLNSNESGKRIAVVKDENDVNNLLSNEQLMTQNDVNSSSDIENSVSKRSASISELEVDSNQSQGEETNLTTDDMDQTNEVDSTSLKPDLASSETCEIDIEKPEPSTSTVSTSDKNSETESTENKVSCNKYEGRIKDKSNESSIPVGTSASDENKENVSSSMDNSNEGAGSKSVSPNDSVSFEGEKSHKSKSNQVEEINKFCKKTDTNSPESSEPINDDLTKKYAIDKEISSSIRELEKSVDKSRQRIEGNVESKKLELKEVKNLDSVIEESSVESKQSESKKMTNLDSLKEESSVEPKKSETKKMTNLDSLKEESSVKSKKSETKIMTNLDSAKEEISVESKKSESKKMTNLDSLKEESSVEPKKSETKKMTNLDSLKEESSVKSKKSETKKMTNLDSLKEESSVESKKSETKKMTNLDSLKEESSVESKKSETKKMTNLDTLKEESSVEPKKSETKKMAILDSAKEGSSVESKKSESKKITNLDLAIERVVEKSRIQTEKKVPILRKFHKDQLKKLTRSELEEVVVSKMCEAVTYKSEIGQMRLRTQNLEETNDIWRKKVQQVEKQNRELEMVLKRFLAELAHIKRENQNKVPMPIKVTRSVGLQVVLASSMHGALVASRNKLNAETAQQQQQAAKAKEVEKETAKETVKALSTFMPPVQPSAAGRGRGRPKTPAPQRPSTPQPISPKVTPPSTPSKPAMATPVKTISTPSKDLEVIDLTEKEEKAKSSNQSAGGGPIRVAPSTQVCFVQQTAGPSPPQQMTYLLQKPGQRSQYLVTTASANPQRTVNNVSRAPTALALPVFRASGQIIPVQTSPQVGMRTNPNNNTATANRQVPQALRLQPQPPVSKHPAPLPSAPMVISKPGMKQPPPKPQLKIAKTVNGIMLSWSMTLTKDIAEMASYQLYAYQEGNQPPSTGLWKKVGDVKALPLPMACTLTQFIEGHKYHFAVRAVDMHGRIGPFSQPSSILLSK